MNITQPPNAFFFVGLIVYIGIRNVFIRRTKNVKTAESRIDSLEKLLLGLIVATVMVLPMLYLFTSLLSLADYHLSVFVRWCGAVALVASLWLFWRSHVDLAQNWSPSLEIRQNHNLVSTGVYHRIRHPMYASIWLWAIAQGLLLNNWLAGWAMLPAFAAMYFIRVPREERMMLDAFGDEYQRYCRRTGRIFPKLGNNHRETEDI